MSVDSVLPELPGSTVQAGFLYRGRGLEQMTPIDPSSEKPLAVGTHSVSVVSSPPSLSHSFIWATSLRGRHKTAAKERPGPRWPGLQREDGSSAEPRDLVVPWPHFLSAGALSVASPACSRQFASALGCLQFQEAHSRCAQALAGLRHCFGELSVLHQPPQLLQRVEEWVSSCPGSWGPPGGNLCRTRNQNLLEEQGLIT